MNRLFLGVAAAAALVFIGAAARRNDGGVEEGLYTATRSSGRHPRRCGGATRLHPDYGLSLRSSEELAGGSDLWLVRWASDLHRSHAAAVLVQSRQGVARSS